MKILRIREQYQEYTKTKQVELEWTRQKTENRHGIIVTKYE